MTAVVEGSMGNTGCSYGKFNLTSANDIEYMKLDMILHE